MCVEVGFINSYYDDTRTSRWESNHEQTLDMLTMGVVKLSKGRQCSQLLHDTELPWQSQVSCCILLYVYSVIYTILFENCFVSAKPFDEVRNQSKKLLSSGMLGTNVSVATFWRWQHVSSCKTVRMTHTTSCRRTKCVLLGQTLAQIFQPKFH
jgi:hypothetical protein